jgi:hypothetical protein
MPVMSGAALGDPFLSLQLDNPAPGDRDYLSVNLPCAKERHGHLVPRLGPEISYLKSRITGWTAPAR